MMQRVFVDGPGPRRRGEGRDRLPLLPRRARRRAEPRQGPRRGADRARPRRVGAGPAARATTCRRTSCPAGRTVPVPYNGSVARMSFGPVVAARVRRWLHEGDFDVLHLHEPATPSLSLLALWARRVPGRGDVPLRQHAGPARCPRPRRSCGPSLEKISARIAVSEDARGTQVSHLGGEPVVIPNGLYVDRFAARRAAPGWRGADGDGGVRRPARRAPQGLRRCSPRRSPRVAADAARAAAAGRRRRRRRRGRERCCPERARPGDVPRPRLATRTRPPRCAPPTCTSHRTPAARASASCSSRRWPPARPCWPATSRRSGGCSTTAPTACCSRTGDADDLAARLAALLDDPARRAAAGRRRPGRRTPLRLVVGGRRRSCGSTRPSSRAAVMSPWWLSCSLVVVLVAVGPLADLDRQPARPDAPPHRRGPRHPRRPAAAPVRGHPRAGRPRRRSTRPAGWCCSTPPTAARNAGPGGVRGRRVGAVPGAAGGLRRPRRRAQLLRADPRVAPLVDELARDCARVELARRFHNDVVVSARALRSRRRVRWLRLAGHARRAARRRPGRRTPGGPRAADPAGGRGRAGRRLGASTTPRVGRPCPPGNVEGRQ